MPPKNIPNKPPNHEPQDFTELVKNISKDFGEGAIRQGKMQGDTGQSSIATISTGSFNLDRATGIGGIPRGRITEIFGPESSGKSTLATHIMAESQKAGLAAAYIDAEHAMDPQYAARCGLNIDHLLISQPDSAEQSFNITQRLIADGRFGVVVIDSVPALATENEIAKLAGEDTVAEIPRLLSSTLRKLNRALNDTALVFINQLRDTISPYGARETTPGGRALKFYTSLRIDLRRTETLMIRSKPVGQTVRARIVKNKCAPPFQTAEFDIYFNEGISLDTELLTASAALGIIETRGAYYYYNGQPLGQGKDNARRTIKDSPIMTQELAKALKKAVKPEPQQSNGSN